MKLAILGAGAWGSALAISFATAHEVRLWGRDAGRIAEFRRTRATPDLPHAAFPAGVALEDDFARAVAGAELVVIATSTAGLRETAGRLRESRPRQLLWACKGFEPGTGRLAHEVVAEALPEATRSGALSGPSFAQEVALGMPTAVVVASSEARYASDVAAALNSARLRIYSSADLRGVELGGAVKNVVAIAAGIADGMGLGHNARAALITRGLAEIVRLGVALGGRPETFAGLTGLGDLVLTCTGALSRNRQVGVGLAEGRTLPRVLETLGHVAEGVSSARRVRELAREKGIEMPIVEAVCGVLFEGIPPEDAVRQLLARDPTAEQRPVSTGS